MGGSSLRIDYCDEIWKFPTTEYVDSMKRFDFDAVTQYVRFWDEKGTKILRYYVPLKFHGSEAVDSDGCNKNCNQIMFNYLHGYQHPQKEVLSQDLVSYLEGDTLKLVELKNFSCKANTHRRSKKGKPTRFHQEQVLCRGSGIIILKCAMKHSSPQNTFNLLALNLYVGAVYESGTTFYRFKKDDATNLKYLKDFLYRKVKIGKLLTAFLVVKKDEEKLSEQQLKALEYDHLYGNIQDKSTFPDD